MLSQLYIIQNLIISKWALKNDVTSNKELENDDSKVLPMEKSS